MKLDISEAYITETGRFDREPPYERTEATTLWATSPSYTDPLLLVDGVNRIHVIQETDSSYLIHYIGYETGYARVSEDGIREFGEQYLADENGIPDWYLEGYSDEHRESPWWVPDSYNPTATVECDRCATTVPVSDLVTPGRVDGNDSDWFCSDCWNDVSDRWSPE